jgi:hypothetical protein
MAVIDEILSKQLQSILAWGSVTYALGFVTVMAHTARLGIPIIQLLEPVYVLVGAPLAVVAFFSRELWRLVKARTAKLTSKLEQIKAEVSEIRARQAEIKTTEEAAQYLSEVLGKVIRILIPDLLPRVAVGAAIALGIYWGLKRSPTVPRCFIPSLERSRSLPPYTKVL